MCSGRRCAGSRSAGFRSGGSIRWDAFILDFYGPRKKLCVELDGGIHDDQQERDAARTEALSHLKIRVIRFRNEEVLHDLASVLRRIEAALDPE